MTEVLWKPINEEFTEAEQAELAADLASEHVAFSIQFEERDGVAGHVLVAIEAPAPDPDIPDAEALDLPAEEAAPVPHIDSFTLRPYV
jgi:hypothetical protein